MKPVDENSAKTVSQALFDRAIYLLRGDYERAGELVQEVWEKVLYLKNIGQEKLNVSYLKKVLDYHFYDRQRLKAYNRHFSLDDLSEAAQPVWPIKDTPGVDEDPYEEGLTEQILGWLQDLKDGWIYLEMIENHYSLKQLAQVKCMKYNTLLQKKNRLDRVLKQKIEKRGGAILNNCMADHKKYFVIFLGFYRYRGKQ